MEKDKTIEVIVLNDKEQKDELRVVQPTPGKKMA